MTIGVLPINLFAEVMFIGIWFWILLVTPITVASFIVWVVRMLPLINHKRFVKKYLKLMYYRLTNKDQKHWQDERKLIKEFITNVIRRDGVFVLYMIGMNAGELTAGQIMCGMWDIYLHSKGLRRKSKQQQEESKISSTSSQND